MDSGDRLPLGRKKFVRQPDGRDEFNLAEFPLTVLTDKTPSGVKTIEWEDEIIDKVTSLPIKRKVIVTGSDAFGLPTALDADVLFALVQLTKQVNNFASRDVFFSRYELLRVLDWRDEGKSYRRIEESLNRWVGTSIYFSAWRDKETETWQSEKFHILDNVTLMSNDHRKRLKARGQGDLAFSSFSWNKIVFRNLQAGFVCPVDLDIYFSLKRSISKRLFRYVGKHFRLRQQEEIAFDLKHFAFEKIGLSRSYGDAGQIKKELQPALEELEAIGFLRPAGRDERYTKIARGEWIITLVRVAAGDPAADRRGGDGRRAECGGAGADRARDHAGDRRRARRVVPGRAHRAARRGPRLAHGAEGPAGLEEPGGLSRRFDPPGLCLAQRVRGEDRGGPPAPGRGGARGRPRRRSGAKRQPNTPAKRPRRPASATTGKR